MDPAHLQTSPLSFSDFRATWCVLKELDGPHYAIYNCGAAAGCSRSHKHLQIFEQTQDLLLPEKILRGDDDSIVPYRYFLKGLNVKDCVSADEAAAHLAEVYHTHLLQCEHALTPYTMNSQQMHTHVPHNVIMTRNFIMTIPRRQAGLGLATANAAGFMGLVWVPSAATVETWKDVGLQNVLAALGVPR